MDPSLRERLRWRSPISDAPDAPAGTATKAWAGALLCVAGALLGPVAVVLPGDAVLDETLLLASCGGALVLALVLIAAYDRLPLWGLHAATLAGTALAGLAVYSWGTESAFGPLPFVWVALFAFYYFPLREALVHGALMAAAYAIALALESPPESAVDGWVATVLTLFVAAVFVAMARDRLHHRIQRLSDAVQHDPLTGLLNRRGFDEVLDVELERARRGDTRLSVVVGDLDGLERANDDHGNAAGDSVLHTTARAIEDVKRGFDSAARIGGEELALIAPDCDEHGAYMLAERTRMALERGLASSAPGLTASFGVATYPLHGRTANSLVGAADRALQAAKRLGGNRSVISSAEVAGILARPPRSGDAHVELAALLSLAEALDRRDTGSATHCQRVGRFAELTARELGLSPDAVERVRLAGILHDVGRVALPDELMRKQGPLSAEEWSLVRSHPEVGARMVETTDYADIRSWILFHHERPDGRGYPEGLGEEEVPVEACILGAADAYEALTSERPYRPALAPEEAAELMRGEAGRQFRRDVVEALLRAV